MYKVVDLFAGAGGLSLGFKQAGKFQIVAAAENNKNAKKTYRRNHPEVDLRDDVREIDYSDLNKKHGKIDVVIGGPPCQGFSNANRQRAQTISMNNALVKEYVRAIQELTPRVFIMENVSMLKSDVHRFYYSDKDKKTIDKLGIKLRKDDLELLPDGFCRGREQELVLTLKDYAKYLWSKKEYTVINVLYRQRNNPAKFENAFKKYIHSLKRFVDRLVDRGDSDSFVLHTDYAMACTIKSLIEGTEENKTSVLQAIELPLMFQRMYYHYSELIENQIVINGFSRNKGICVKVSSFPVYEYIEKMLSAAPYSYRINAGVLNAVNFGAPQKRERYIIVGVRKGNKPQLPVGETVEPYRTVREAIEDLQEVKPFYDVDSPSIPLGPYSAKKGSLISQLRDSKEINNHIITKTGETAKKRFAALEQGQNFHDLKEELKSTYTNYERTQNTIYLRLKYDEPCGTVVNVRKSMWIHPELDRALSIREAARLQTFPDSFVFEGTKDSQYQQVGNAVPPILAKAIAFSVIAILENKGVIRNYE